MKSADSSDNPEETDKLPLSPIRPLQRSPPDNAIESLPAEPRRPVPEGTSETFPDPAASSPAPSEFRLTLLVSTTHANPPRRASTPRGSVLPVILSPV